MNYKDIYDGASFEIHDFEKLDELRNIVNGINNNFYQSALEQARNTFCSTIQKANKHYVYVFNTSVEYSNLLSECGYKTSTSTMNYYEYKLKESLKSGQEYYSSGYSGTLDTSTGHVELHENVDSKEIQYWLVTCNLKERKKNIASCYAYCDQKNANELIEKTNYLNNYFEAYKLTKKGRIIGSDKYIKFSPVIIFLSAILLLSLGVLTNITLLQDYINLSLVLSILVSIILLSISIIHIITIEKFKKVTKGTCEANPKGSIYYIIPSIALSLMIVICAKLKPNTFLGDYNNFLSGVIWIVSVIDYLIFIFFIFTFRDSILLIKESKRRDKTMVAFNNAGGKKQYENNMREIKELIEND